MDLRGLRFSGSEVRLKTPPLPEHRIGSQLMSADAAETKDRGGIRFGRSSRQCGYGSHAQPKSKRRLRIMRHITRVIVEWLVIAGNDHHKYGLSSIYSRA